MDNREAVNWLINISADIGKAEHSDLWHYEQTLTEIKDMLESAQPEPSEITDEQAILHLQSTGWMQNHDREMYESGLRKQLADDSESYNSLIPCEDTISRQAAIDALDCINGAEEVLRALPPSQPEQKTGHWIAPKYYPTQFTFTCSKCGYKQSFNGKFKFCPNCGADMRGERDGD